MIAVVDASAAIEIVLQRGMAEKLGDVLRAADWVLAPHLFVSEIANTFWKYHRYGGLSIRECEQRLEQAISLPDDLVDEMDILREAFKQSCTSNHVVYDMMYAIIARRHNATLLTLDKKLIQMAKLLSVDIV